MHLILSIHILLWIAAGIIWSRVSGWPFELFTHWIVTWLLLAAGLCAVAVWQKEWGYSASALLVALLLGVKLFTGYTYDIAVWSQEKPAQSITLAQWNVYNGNDYVFRWIATLKDVDVIVLNEVKPWVRDRISGSLPDFPYKLLPEGFAPDTVILSKLPLSNTRIAPIEGSPRFLLSAEIEKDGKRVALTALHTSSPRIPSRYERRAAELNAVEKAVKAQTLPVVVSGDLNITAYSPDFAAFMSETKLALSKTPLALPVTWPAIPVPGLGLSIDHMLVSKGIVLYARNAQYGVCCSDHAPVVTTFRLMER